MPLQIRRGTEAERQSAVSLIPQTGELVWITDQEKLYIGDGTTELKNLTPITGYNDEDAADHIGAVLQAGPHTGLSFNYVDAAGTISATISPTQNLTTLNVTGTSTLGATNVTGNVSITGDIAVTGNLTADFNGSIFGDDSTILVDGVDNKINLDGTVKGNIIPDASEAYDIGSPSEKFKDLYLSGTSLWLGTAQVTATGSAINLPAGSRVGGNLIQDAVSEDTAFIRDIQGSVFADDSTQLVNAIDATVRLNNGVVNIDGASITSTALEFDISNATESPNTTLNVYNADGASAVKIFSIGGQDNFNDPSGMTLRGFFGGFAGSGSEIAPIAGDYVGFVNGQVYDPTFGGGTNVLTSQISFGVDPNATVGPDEYPGVIEFSVNTATGSSPNFETMVYNGVGLGIKADPVATLDVNGFMKLAPLAAAPATLVNGLIAIDDGTTNWSGHASGVQAVVAYINTGWVKLNN
jgi:cytoskeletal protein CcmA (bactofilin family)